jgi:hypothetical protein
MINQQLVDFIKQQLQVGLTKEKISSELLANGWNTQDIEEGFKATGIPIPPAPAPVSPASPIYGAPTLNPTPVTTQSLNPNLYPHLNDIKTVNDIKPAVVKVKQSGKGLFLVVLIIILLAIGSSIYYFKDNLLSLPVIKDLFPTQNVTVLPEVPVQTDNTQAVTQQPVTTPVTQPVDINADSSLSIYTDPNGLYSFSYPKGTKIEYGGDYPSVYMTTFEADINSIITVVADVNENMFNAVLTDKSKYEKSSFGNIDSYPAYKYVPIDTSKDFPNTSGGIYIIDLGSYNNTKLSIIVSVLSGVSDLKTIGQIEEIIKSFTINKNNIPSAVKVLLVKLSETQNHAKDLSIEQPLGNVRTDAEIYYGKSNSYTGFCKSGEYTNAMKNIIKLTKLNCKDSANAYAITASISSGYWCIDNTGYNNNSSLNTGTVCIK